MTALVVNIEIPDFTTISDEALEELLPHNDGAWSRQTRWLMQHFGASDLNLNAAWALRSTRWTCPCCRRSKSEIARLTPAGILLCQLDFHHDHLRDHAEKLFAAGRPPIEADEALRRRWHAGVSACKNLIERLATNPLHRLQHRRGQGQAEAQGRRSGSFQLLAVGNPPVHRDRSQSHARG